MFIVITAKLNSNYKQIYCLRAATKEKFASFDQRK
jgi:hypothetical protein